MRIFMRIVMCTLGFFFAAATVFAVGTGERASGQFKQFTYQDGNVGRSVRAEYIGHYLKTFSLSGSGSNTVFLMEGNFRPWNGEYTGWEDLGRERIPYADADTLKAAADGVPMVSVTEMDGNTIIMEATPDEDGDYWWWTTDGRIAFYQNVYVVRR